MSNQSPKSMPKPKQVSIEIPKDLSAVYANVAFISHTPAEMVIDFAQVLPRMPKGSVMSRVIMSPIHAKMLLRALGQNIDKYEQQFGEIRTPIQSTLADQNNPSRPNKPALLSSGLYGPGRPCPCICDIRYPHTPIAHTIPIHGFGKL